MTLLVHPTEAEKAQLGLARQILRDEACALLQVAERLDDGFVQAADLLARCRGRVCITGIGKSADIGQKIAGTFNSTGSRAYLLDATRAVHGDLGMLHPDDVVLALSHSGESEELIRLLPSFRQMASAVVSLVGNARSTLARESDAAIILGPLDEACPLGLAPSTSTTAMIAVGDALAFVLMKQRGFSYDDFARFHPAGSLGRKLLKVDTVMRQGAAMRLARASDSVREVFASRRPGRRTGAVMLVDDDGRLCGLFTDSDLARLFEQHRDDAIDGPVADVMTPNPLTVPQGSRLLDAIEIMRRRKFSELPVVDADTRPVGLIDITDVLALLPREEAENYWRMAG